MVVCSSSAKKVDAANNHIPWHGILSSVGITSGNWLTELNEENLGSTEMTMPGSGGMREEKSLNAQGLLL